ncbi:MAG: hypothetical protein WAN23_10685 [Candidatus Acidiferrales bacterium]
MRSFWRGVGRVIFWSYERGSWPYDVMVVAILLFVLVTPRKWFHDESHASVLASSDVQIVSQDTDSDTRTYRLDAKALPPEKRATKSTPELERETHDILGRTAGDLKGQTFQVVRIDPALSSGGSVLYYDVTVHP